MKPLSGTNQYKTHSQVFGLVHKDLSRIENLFRDRDERTWDTYPIKHQ